MMFIDFLIPAVVLAAIACPLLYAHYNARKGGRVSASKKALFVNLGAFAAICLVGIVFPFGGFASAAGTATTSLGIGDGLGLLAAALSVGLAGIGGGIAVAKGSAAAIGALSENRSTFGLSIVFVALGEGIALYGLLISFLILNHVH